MTTEQRAQIEELFAQASERPETERAALLAACGDRAVADEVASLLAAMVQATQSLGGVVGNEVATLVRKSGRGRVGPYRLGDVLGEGGMGIVYAAERDDGQFRQRVAIKLLKHGVAANRFRDERQILATLSHPNIVKLLDGGTTDDGLPYLVMERVDGAPITSGERELDATLQLFREVCEAVHHAHGIGVVHRDLKPSNILVDTHGAVKLLDFGIAKLSGDREAHTQTGAALMTPQYASPEQLRGGEATTASDVYSLGAVLYELVSKRSPRTGTLLTILNDTRPITQPAGPRELANIVMMALADEPARRYATAEALADDLGRYLAGLPVRAHAPTLGYRARKLARRHRGKLAAVALAATVAGIAWRAWPSPPWQAAIEPVPWRDVDAATIPDALSPDGKKLAFISSSDDDSRRLVVLDLASGTFDVVAHNVLGALRWTASGDGWLYLDAQARLVRQDNGGITDLGFAVDDAADCGDTLMRLHEDYKGQWIQLREPDGSWRTVHRLHADMVATWPRCDPASKRILVVESPTEPGICAGHALLVERDGTVRTIGDAICTATLTPGGRSIVYSASRGGRINLFEKSIDGGDEHAITTGAGPDMRPDVSADGSTLAFSVEVVTAGVSFNGDRVSLRGQIDQVAVTRDGERIVAQQSDDFDRQLAIVTLRHGERGPHRLAAGALLALSIDDRRVYFHPVNRPNEIRAVSIDGGDSTLVATVPGHLIRGAEAADGLHVLVENDHVFASWRVPASGPLVAEGAPGLVLPAPHGGWRVVLVPGEGGDIVLQLVPPDGGAPREHRVQLDRIAWVDDTTLAITEPARGFSNYPATLDVRTNQVTPLAPARELAFVVAAADGKHWIATDAEAHPTRQLITNFASRPWRP